jgi:hypothetical protein
MMNGWIALILISSGVSPPPIGKTPETDAIPCVDVWCSSMQPPEDGAMSSEDIQGDEWGI